MPTYVFKGRNRMNEVVMGERVADDRDALRQVLRREQVTLTSVKEKGREIGIPKLAGRKKVKSKDLAIFTRQFSVMIDAGLPLHLQGIQDCRILEVPQLLRTHPTRRISRATLQQFRRTQQASQLIRAIMHGCHPVIFLSHLLVDFRSI